MNSLFHELTQRHVFRVAALYVAVGWVLIQLAIALEDTLSLPGWFDTLVTVLVLIGFPVALVLAWALEVTPEGIKLASTVNVAPPRNPTLDYVLAAVLVLLVSVIVADCIFGRDRPALPFTVAGETQAEKSIAVLAFADLSPDKDQEYFSDGMAEEILNALVKVPGLRVAGRISAFSFKDKNVDARDVGKALNVSHLLEGSVRKQGNQVRITAQLIKADDGYHLWSESYDGSLDNIFELQDQISRAVATELKGVLGVEDATPLVAKLTENKEAYDLYLQGRDLMFRTWGLDTLPNAVRLLKRAVALDPEFAEAWGVLGRATHLLPQYVPVADEQPYREAARQAAETSISLDPSLPYGYSVLASLAVVEHDHVEAYELWKKAFTLDGSSVTQAFSMGYGLSVLGRSREALLYLEKAVETDPMQGILMLNLGIAKLNNGDAEEAERHARRSVELGFIGAAFTVAELLAERGEYEKAVAYINEQRQSLNAYAPMYRSDEQWQLAITAGYTDNEEAKQIAVEGIEGYLQTPDAVVNTSIVEALRSFHAPELFMETLENNRFSNSSYVLTRLWSGTEASNLIRRHPGFPGFAERIGLLAAWQEFGWPDKCRPNEGTDGSNGRFTCD